MSNCNSNGWRDVPFSRGDNCCLFNEMTSDQFRRRQCKTTQTNISIVLSPESFVLWTQEILFNLCAHLHQNRMRNGQDGVFHRFFQDGGCGRRLSKKMASDLSLHLFWLRLLFSVWYQISAVVIKVSLSSTLLLGSSDCKRCSPRSEIASSMETVLT